MNRGVALSLHHLYVQRNDLIQFIKNMEAIWGTSEREVEGMLGPAPTNHPTCPDQPPRQDPSGRSLMARKAALMREVREVIADISDPVKMETVMRIMYDRHPDRVKEWNYHSRIQGLVHQLVEEGDLIREGPGQYRRTTGLEQFRVRRSAVGRR